jgi:hypothetical protein
MTPREIAGFLFFARRRRRHEQADALAIAALGARGDPKDVDDTIKQWSRE